MTTNATARVLVAAAGLGGLFFGVRSTAVATPGDDEPSRPGGPSGGAGSNTGTPDAAPGGAHADDADAETKCELSDATLKKLTDEDRRDIGASRGFSATRTRYENGLTDDLYIVVGPDGHQRGVIPSGVREDSQIYVIVDRPEEEDYAVRISGCDRTATRVLGGPIQNSRAGTPTPPPPTKEGLHLTYDLYSLGRCNADKEVKIEVDVSASHGCKAATETVEFQTSPVFNFTVGYGAVYVAGSHTHVGLDLGAGGAPSTAFEREGKRGLSDRILLGWFPLGYSPETGLFDNEQGQYRGVSLLRHVMLGTTVDPEEPLASVNALIGLEPASGLALFFGVQFCEKENRLGAGLSNGSIYTDDSSTLPKSSTWRCDTSPFFGVSATTELLGKLFAR